MDKSDIQSVFAKNDLNEYLCNFYQIRVVYYADDDLDQMCRKLTGSSLPEKFSVFIDNAYVRDVVGTTAGTVQRRIGFRFINSKTLPDFNSRRFDEVVKDWFDDESSNLTPFLSNGVHHAYSTSSKSELALRLMSTISDCPWYSHYRQALIETTEASRVEFMSACISCLFLTAESAGNPSNNLVAMAKQHDERSSIRTPNSPQSVSTAAPAGPSRHLLVPCPRCCAVIFSPSSPTDSGNHLSASIEQAKSVLPGLMTQPIPFVPIDNSASAKPSALLAGLFARLARDVVLPSLMQWSERHITQLAEQLNSRRGLSTQLRTIFSAGSKPSAKISSRGSSGALNGQGGTAGGNDVVYSDESSEIQLRRLSDLALLMGAYDIAFEGYHRLKDDFQRDQALLPQATALEAAAVALILHPQPSSKRYPITCLKYLENALSLYQSLSPSVPMAQQLSVRCGLLYADTLRSLRNFSEAAAVFRRLAPDMTQASPELDLRSAICLEQAAHCWAALKPNARLRKAAFNLLLAGARYSRAGKRRHGLRCYQSALPTYAGKGLALAEDHVLLTVGRQSFALKDSRTAVEAFAGILCHYKDTLNKHQTPVTQASLVREYLYVANTYQDEQARYSNLASSVNVVLSPVPVFPSSFILTDPSLLNNSQKESLDLPENEDLQVLANLEEPAVKTLINTAVFKPAKFLFSSIIRGKKPKKQENPTSFVNEPFLLLVNVENPMDIPFLLKGVSVTGSVEDNRGVHVFGHGEAGSLVTIIAPDIIELQPREQTRIAIKLICSAPGKLDLHILCAGLSTPPSNDDQSSTFIHAHWPLESPWAVEVFDTTANLAVKIDNENSRAHYIPGTLVPMRLTFEISGDKEGVNSMVLSTNRSDCFQLTSGTIEETQPPGQMSSDVTKTWKVDIPPSASASSPWSINALVRVAPSAQEVSNLSFGFNILVAYEPTKRSAKRRYRLAPVLVKMPFSETPFLLSVAATPHPASPVGLLNIRDCERFCLGFSTSLMLSNTMPWTVLHLHRLALVSSSLLLQSNQPSHSCEKSMSRVVSTIDVIRRKKRLSRLPDALNLELLSIQDISLFVGSELAGEKGKEELSSDLFRAIVSMGKAAHHTSIFSSASSPSTLSGVFVFVWSLHDNNSGNIVRGCNFVVDPPLFSSDQFSSAVYAASDPSSSARRIGFGLARDSTVSTAGSSDPKAPIVIHLEYPQFVEVTDQSTHRIPVSVFCRNRSSQQVEILDCNLPLPEIPGSKDDIYGSSGLLWVAPHPTWPLLLEPNQAVSVPLALLATHSGVFRPIPPSIEYVAPPSSNKSLIRPDFGPFIQVTYSEK